MKETAVNAAASHLDDQQINTWRKCIKNFASPSRKARNILGDIQVGKMLQVEMSTVIDACEHKVIYGGPVCGCQLSRKCRLVNGLERTR